MLARPANARMRAKFTATGRRLCGNESVSFAFDATYVAANRRKATPCAVPTIRQHVHCYDSQLSVADFSKARSRLAILIASILRQWPACELQSAC